MFVMGNLQSAKSIGYKKDWLDRLDSFILMLELFFQMDKKKPDSQHLNKIYF